MTDKRETLRILIIQNLYPPEGPGGYARACESVVVGLRSRGHQVWVLTSNYGLNGDTSCKDDIWRVLEPNNWDLLTTRRLLPLRERHNQRFLNAAFREFQPDLIFVWGMNGISKSILANCRARGLPMVYAIHDEWLLNYRHDPWLTFWRRTPITSLRRAIKQVLLNSAVRSLAATYIAPTKITPDTRYCIFPSAARSEEYDVAGFELSNAVVIPNGVDTDMFSPRPQFPGKQGMVYRLLYSGAVIKGKGIHTVLDALAKLDPASRRRYQFDIAGPSPDSAYILHLQYLIRQHDLGNQVRFLGPIPHSAMGQLYRDHDILVFPSVLAEGLPLTLLEAMSCGLLVVATPAGGSKEILDNGINSMVFAPEDTHGLADALNSVLHEPTLLVQLGNRARHFILADFSQSTMWSRIESYLIWAYTDSVRFSDKVQS